MTIYTLENTIYQEPADHRTLFLATSLLFRTLFETSNHETSAAHNKLLYGIKQVLMQATDPTKTYYQVCSMLLQEKENGRSVVDSLITKGIGLMQAMIFTNTHTPIAAGKVQVIHQAIADAVLDLVECNEQPDRAYWQHWFAGHAATGSGQIYNSCLQRAAHFHQLKTPIMTIGTKITVMSIKDIMRLTGKSNRTAQRLHSNIKKKYHKKRGDFVTIDEFCLYTGFTAERVWHILQ